MQTGRFAFRVFTTRHGTRERPEGIPTRSVGTREGGSFGMRD
ncbi:MAG: hypothetical protein AB7S75_01030 [Desulfococcaceae bacterium]